MRVLGIIPARGGSKGVPGKNKKLLGGKPLIQYTIDTAKQSKLLTDIIISSDDEDIINIALHNKIKVPYKRPKYLSGDETATIDVVMDILNFYQKKGVTWDYVCLLQPTTPFRPKSLIDHAIKKIKNNADSLISVIKVPHQYNPHWIFERDSKDSNFLKISTGEKEIIKRRQDLPTSYIRSGDIYLTKYSVIMGEKSFYGNSVSFIEIDESNHVNIDTIEDWQKAELLIQ